MFRPLELFIGLRYSRAKRRNQFISFISTVSIVCIAISVTALITVMSVMNGFDYQLRARILGAVSHVMVSANVPIAASTWQAAAKQAEGMPHVVGAAPYVELQAWIEGAGSAASLVRGIDPALEPRVSDINRHMVQGRFDALTPGSWNIVLGQDLAAALGVGVGDRVVLVTPQLRATPMGALPLMRAFHVVGIFAVGSQEYDSGLALIDIADAEKLAGLAGPQAVRLKLDDMDRAPAVKAQLASALGPLFTVQDWEDQNPNFFSAISMEKKVMFIILSLIILVAVINLISMLMMLVTDKQAEIAILRTLGSTPRSIMGTFMVQGVLVGVVGTLAGLACGVLLSWQLPAIARWIERTFHVTFLPSSVYYIDEVPSRLDPHDVLWVAVITFLFSLLATLYPAWRASRTQPAQALRYE